MAISATISNAVLPAGVSTNTQFGRFDAQFLVSPPYASGGEVCRRFSIGFISSAYTLSKERFRVIAPESYTNDLSWGLLVWMSPGREPGIPKDWPEVLAKHKLLFVSPLDAGNDRHPQNRQAGAIERFRLGLDACYNMRLRYRISPKRIYVAGFSGGARIASMLGVAYSDVFTGTIPICGVNFYMTIPAGGDQVWPADYKTQVPHLNAAKTQGRFVLITGGTDVNRPQTLATYEQGFQKYGFAHVQYLEVPGMGHAVPGGEYLARALKFVDGRP
jgi:predicted esterase